MATLPEETELCELVCVHQDAIDEVHNFCSDYAKTSMTENLPWTKYAAMP